MLKGSIGTVSHGTLRPMDLLKAFTNALDSYYEKNTPSIVTEARVILRTWEDGPITDSDAEYLQEVVSALVDALNDIAPEGCYFGAHEGDGSDFGFWPLPDDPDSEPLVSNRR